MPKRRRLRRGGSDNSCVRKRAVCPSHVWRYDFVEARTTVAVGIRMLVVIDEFTREALAIEVAWSFTAWQVVDVLGYLVAVRGIPEHIGSDNGPEFAVREATRWRYHAKVETLFIAKESPWENGCVESFNSRLRDQLLNRELFTSLEGAR